MKKSYIILLGIFLLFAAPLAGGLIRGLPDGFFRFPPLVVKAAGDLPFSWGVFLLFFVLFALALGFICCPDNFGFKPLKRSELRAMKKRREEDDSEREAEDKPQTERKRPTRLPSWGYAGGGLLAVSWIFAWGRFAWLGALSDYLFFPLWLGYILLIDGQCVKRGGESMLTRHPRSFWLLFPLSALLWWYFEYLNRFVHNWWYEGIGGYSALRYIVYASLCFSTVLPAVFETACLLLTFPYYHRAFARGPVFRAQNEIFAFGGMCLGVLMLFLTGLFPAVFYPLVWLGPLVICAGSLGLASIRTPFAPLVKGHFVFLVTLAVAALLCGVCWELWNMYSLPKWHYSVPYVNRYRIFEMPIPGYAGYLPFGILCWCGWLMLYNLLPEKQRAKSAALEAWFEEKAESGGVVECD
jgi:hypothetical protein